MKTQTIAPTGVSQHFEINETFFSTTDPRGIITSGNQVFTRTSGYSFDELIGSPHNLIRHPDIPRCVFSMLWKRAHAKHPFSGYVKNQAKNGNHYWVFALIEAQDGELLSIRIKPSSPVFDTIDSLYSRLIEIEENALAKGESPQEAAAQSEAELLDQLRKLGFESYDAFSQHCLNLEIKSRDKIVASRNLQLIPKAIQGKNEDRYKQATAAYSKLENVFAKIDNFLSLADTINKSQKAVARRADDFRNYALNASIAATQFGTHGATIDTITQFLHIHAGDFLRNADRMADITVDTNSILKEINSRLASARIQLEMLINFLAESAQNESEEHGVRRINSLQSAFSITASDATQALLKLDTHLPGLLGTKEDLQKTIISFNVAQISGLMECSRIPRAEALTTMFEDLRLQIEQTKTELDNSDSVITELKRLAKSTPSKIREVLSCLTREPASNCGF